MKREVVAGGVGGQGARFADQGGGVRADAGRGQFLAVGRPEHRGKLGGMMVARSAALFVLAALFEIGGAWLVWQGVREHRGWVWIGAGVLALGVYGFVATFQPDAHFGRILAAYGGIFVAGSIAWGMVADGYRPDRWDVSGALICLAGMAVIMYAPRGG